LLEVHVSYDMEFRGEFGVEPPLRPEHLAYLRAFNGSRRLKRDPVVAASLDDPVRVAAGLPIGAEGEYFVGHAGNWGKESVEGAIVPYAPPASQPGGICCWVPNDDGTALLWDGQRKFMDWEPWLCYLIDHFLRPWGYVVSGRVEWRGEEWLDVGVLRVRDNEVSVGVQLGDLDF
jgi:hypothetical protein